MRWRDKASCRGVDPALFFADSEGGAALRRMQPVAERNCRACPVLERCAEYADDRREVGLWAGTYRTTRTGAYLRSPLFPGAPLFELGPKVAEAGVGAWVA
jgi:WhiB family transcriptional regulator, redox-sensing transcriptional regulator